MATEHRELWIAGAGGVGREALDTALAAGVPVAGFLDDRGTAAPSAACPSAGPTTSRPGRATWSGSPTRRSGSGSPRCWTAGARCPPPSSTPGP